MMPPPLEEDSIPAILSALKYKLYAEPELAKKAAQLLSERLRGPWLVPAGNVNAVVGFLLEDSKAEPDFVAQQLANDCSGNADSASVVLWLLVQSKTNPVAAKALADFRQDTGNKEMLAEIESGSVSKQQAYDQPLERRFPK